MRAMCPTAGEAAISRGVKDAVDENADVKSDAGNRDWFVEMVRALLPTKPGTALHFITGYDERLCQKYAAGHVKPSAFFLRNMLRSEQGAQFLAALMEGCDAPWWLECQRAQRLAAVAERFRAEIEDI